MLRRLTILAVVVALAAIAWWAATAVNPTRDVRPDEEAPGAPAAAVAAAATAADAEDQDRVPAAAPVAPPRPVEQAGTLHRFDGAPAAGVDYWLWGADQPGWTKTAARAGHSMDARELQAPDGTTDARGRWRFAEPPRAVTFRITAAAVVSYECGDGLDLHLPEVGEIRGVLQGAGPTDAWEVLFTPAYTELDGATLEHECATHAVYPIATASGPAVVSVKQVGWRGRGDEVAIWTGVVGLPSQVLASGARLVVEPDLAYVTAPAVVPMRVAAREPVFDVAVVDVSGARAAVAGLASLARADGRLASHGELENGAAELAGSFAPDQRFRADVLTADGEHFTRDLVFDGAARSSLRFVRGEGRAPLRVEIGREVDVGQIATIALVGDDGSLRFASRTVYLIAFDAGQAAFGQVDAQTLWLQDAGLRWLDAHLLLRDGNVAMLHRPQAIAAAGVQVEWLPTVALEPVALAERPRGERGQFEVRIGIPIGTSGPHWVTLRWLQYGPTTGLWPTWEQVAPPGYGCQLRHRRVGHDDEVTGLATRR